MILRSYVDKLRNENKLIEISKQVSPKYEIAAILKELDGKPVYFDNVENCEMPVVGNLFSSPDLLASSINIKKEGWIKKMIAAIEKPGQLVDGTNRFEYREPDLDTLSILTHYPMDPGPYITSDVTLAKKGDKRNASVHRMLKLGKDRLTVRLVEKRDLHTMYMNAKEHGEDLPVAITIGNSPSVMIAASTTVSWEMYELELAAALEGQPIEVVSGKTIPIKYPCDSEIVLEGRILHDETEKEGPFLDLTETYDVVREQPVIVIDKIAVQKNPIFHALLPAGNDHKLLMGQPRTPTIYKSLLDAGIGVDDVYLTVGGSGWLDAVVSIKKKSELDGKRSIDAVIEGHKSVKKITIVDDGIDITNPDYVNYAVTMYWEAGKEHITKGVKGSSLDPMGTPEGIGSKIGIDATKPLVVPEEKKGKMERAKIGYEIDIKDYL